VSKPKRDQQALNEQALDIERAKRIARNILDAEERGTVAPPDILTLRERLARPRSPVVWRIAQLQCAGHRVLLAAQFKAGKTTMVINVIRSLVDGDMFLDTYDVAALSGSVVPSVPSPRRPLKARLSYRSRASLPLAWGGAPVSVRVVLSSRGTGIRPHPEGRVRFNDTVQRTFSNSDGLGVNENPNRSSDND
jgi:hypothetical protein